MFALDGSREREKEKKVVTEARHGRIVFVFQDVSTWKGLMINIYKLHWTVSVFVPLKCYNVAFIRFVHESLMVMHKFWRYAQNFSKVSKCLLRKQTSFKGSQDQSSQIKAKLKLFAVGKFFLFFFTAAGETHDRTCDCPNELVELLNGGVAIEALL